MDLPTYTSIWRIEKRLYKLYDFRLPMPLPIGQVSVFAAIAVPYVVLLEVLGLPFNHSLIWLYILPPGVLTWLATRPVLEGKRLPELIKSQVRYLAEPRAWCRMAPSSERDVIVVTGRVWRPGRAGRRQERRAPAAARRALPVRRRQGAQAQAPPVVAPPVVAPPMMAPPVAPPRVAAQAVQAGHPVRVASAPGRAAPRPSWPLAGAPGLQAGRPPARPARAESIAQQQVRQQATPVAQRPEPAPAPRPVDPARAEPVVAGPASAQPKQAGPELAGPELAGPELAGPELAGPEVAELELAEPERAGPEVAEPELAAVVAPLRPLITVVGVGPAQAAPPAVERALAGPSARRGDVRAGRVTVVPGGHRPGQPDQAQRDRARAQQPISGPARIVVLGCTVGAGQTVTALLTGEMLASLRTDAVAVLDLNPGAASLARRALARPALSQAASLGPSRLTVLRPQRAADDDEAGEETIAPPPDPAYDAMTFEAASSKYDIVLADPSTAAVPRLLALTDQLVLVAPASAAAASAIAMTFEWLEAHGQAGLADEAIMVLNGVSRRSVPHVEQAERVCAGRCRAMVRVPWDDQLNSRSAQRQHPAAPGSPAHQRWAGLLSPGTAGAYTALAGVLVAALANGDLPGGDLPGGDLAGIAPAGGEPAGGGPAGVRAAVAGPAFPGQVRR